MNPLLNDKIGQVEITQCFLKLLAMTRTEPVNLFTEQAGNTFRGSLHVYSTPCWAVHPNFETQQKGTLGAPITKKWSTTNFIERSKVKCL